MPPRDALLLELLAWFKSSFFSWVDTVRCDSCNSRTEVTFVPQHYLILFDRVAERREAAAN
jgi:hypothetical protein